MLILIGTVPTAYALNKAVTPAETQTFLAVSHSASEVLQKYAGNASAAADSRAQVEKYVQTKTVAPDTIASLKALVDSIDSQIRPHDTVANVPQGVVKNVRNEMYIASEALRIMEKQKAPAFSSDDDAVLGNYKKQLDHSTKFIPTWVKVAVAVALGLGTMVGWKRIVVTVGERIGKTHLTYGQGASAEMVAMLTIGAADMYGLPVSTTHVLSSGVAGTMAANGSGLQWRTVRSLALAWILTLPVSIVLSGALFWMFRGIF
jgi:inorganic phosphate transporter, PiT family